MNFLIGKWLENWVLFVLYRWPKIFVWTVLCKFCGALKEQKSTLKDLDEFWHQDWSDLLKPILNLTIRDFLGPEIKGKVDLKLPNFIDLLKKSKRRAFTSIWPQRATKTSRSYPVPGPSLENTQIQKQKIYITFPIIPASSWIEFAKLLGKFVAKLLVISFIFSSMGFFVLDFLCCTFVFALLFVMHALK